MKKEILKERYYVDELLKIIRSGISEEKLAECLSDYHENDIAGALEQLDVQERKKIYSILGTEKISEIFAYIEDVELYLNELELENAAEIISYMDSDDAVDVLEEMDSTTKEKIVSMMDNESSKDVQLILSYDDDEMGDDYAKLAGLTAEEDLVETTKESMKKRLPWLIILLFLGIGVSSVVGVFENVVAVLPIVICFQSLILDMAGNVGTQSLAVTFWVCWNITNS